MEFISSPAKKYVNSEATFKVKLPDYETRRVEGTFLDEEGTKQDGKTLIAYKGNTSQEGTPTPDNPIDVNVVTGENKVVVSNKNLFSINNAVYGRNRIQTITDDNNFTLFGDGTSQFVVILIGKVSDFIGKSLSVNISYTTTYSLSGAGFALITCDINGGNRTNIGNTLSISNNVVSGTRAIDNTLDNTKYIGIRLYSSHQTSNNTVNYSNAQIEIGSTATDYIQHQEQSHEINLGKNLFNFENYTSTSTGLTTNINGTHLTISGTSTSTSKYITQYIENEWEAGTYTFSISEALSRNLILRFYDDNNTTITNVVLSSNTNSITATLDGTEKKYRLIFNPANGGTYDIDINLQFEKGSLTPYAPYFEPIELCKIGDYQDYIYRQNGTWYLHKEVEKVVLNGSESWSIASSGRYFAHTISDIQRSSGGSQVANAYMNYYSPYNYNSIYNGTPDYGFAIGYNASTVAIRNKDITSKTDFTTWLSSNNVTLYYVLATPTDTEITNQALISQLEYIKNNLKTYEEETIISQVNSDLPFYLDVLMEI